MTEPNERKKTSLNISSNTHGSLYRLAKKHNRSMSSELEILVAQGWLIDEAGESIQEVIKRMVEERLNNEQEAA